MVLYARGPASGGMGVDSCENEPAPYPDDEDDDD